MNTAHQMIRASAGTGKTFCLSSRYLQLLGGHGKPANILATTFTRKAAGEILERVLQRLATACIDMQSAAELAAQLGDDRLTLPRCRALLTEVCQALHAVSIGTIDSFFSRLAICFANELHLPVNAKIVAADDPQMVQIRRDAIEAMLGEEQLETVVDLLRRLHHDSANRRVIEAFDEIICDLYEAFQSTDESAWGLMPVRDELSESNITEGCDQLANLLKDRECFEKSHAKALQSSYDKALAGDWNELIAKGIPQKMIEAGPGGGDIYYVSKKVPVPHSIVDALHPLVVHAQAVRWNNIAKRTHAMFDLLFRFHSHFDRLRREQGILLFSDLPLRLARGLQSNDPATIGDVYYRMDAVISHLLLDEFQDTSPLQWRVLMPFALEAASAVEHDTPIAQAERSFFCVGDTKQAIYGWRGGCAEVFDQVERDLQLPPESLQTLSKSYRSAQPVLDAVNALLTGMDQRPPFDGDTGEALGVSAFAARFETHVAARKDLRGYVELRTSPAVSAVDDDDAMPLPRNGDGGSDDDDNDRTPGHDAFVAERIATLARRHPTRSIGVLVRTNKMVNELIFRVRKLGVDASGEGGNPVTDDAAVNLVLSALTLADHPGDQAAAFHVVNSPLASAAPIRLTSREPAVATEAARRIRREFLSRGYAAVLSDWARHLAPACDTRSAVRLGQLVELADQYESARSHRCKDFVSFVRAARIEEPTAAPVRIMTVHKSKGLEFDIVVLPDLHGAIASVRSTGIYCLRDDEVSDPAAIFAAADGSTRDMIAGHLPEYGEAHLQEKRRRLFDDLCALYVAVTRPRFALHVLIPPLKARKDGSTGTPGWTNMSGATIVRRALSEIDESFDGDETLYTHGDRDWDDARETTQTDEMDSRSPSDAPSAPDEQAERIAISFASGSHKGAVRTLQRVAPSTLAGGGHVRAEALLSTSGEGGRRFGSLIHGWFEKITWLDDHEAEQDLADEALLAVADNILSSDARPWAADQLPHFRRMIAQPSVRACLSKPAKASDDEIELWRERDFAVRLDDQLMRGTFDRVVIQKTEGRATGAQIIDFKADRNADDIETRRALAGQYRPQMIGYQKALAKILSIPPESIECKLLFVSCRIAEPMTSVT